MHDHDLRPEVQAKRKTPSPTAKEASSADHGSPATTGLGPAASALLRLQRNAGNAGVVQMLADDDVGGSSPIHDVIGKGGGTALDPGTRNTMERQLGQDFGDVKVHTDARASASAASVGANAYTVGNEIVFRSGHFDTATPTGQRTLAHELTHVVQQRSGPVDGSDAPGGIRLSDPNDRFERAAEAAASGVVATTAQTSVDESTAATPASVQRDAETEEELDL